jgi:hypothetical protein
MLKSLGLEAVWSSWQCAFGVELDRYGATKSFDFLLEVLEAAASFRLFVFSNSPSQYDLLSLHPRFSTWYVN